MALDTGESKATDKMFWLACIQAIGLSTEQESDLRVIYDQQLVRSQNQADRTRQVMALVDRMRINNGKSKKQVCILQCFSVKAFCFVRGGVIQGQEWRRAADCQQILIAGSARSNCFCSEGDHETA